MTNPIQEAQKRSAQGAFVPSSTTTTAGFHRGPLMVGGLRRAALSMTRRGQEAAMAIELRKRNIPD